MKFFSLTFTLVFLLILSSGVMALDRVNLAVMNFSSDKEDGLGMGFSETLIDKLNNFENINVIDKENERNSLSGNGISTTQKFDSSKCKSYGDALGVDYIINGNLKEKGTDVLINSQLFEVNSGTVVAEESIKGNKNKLFELQAELAMRVGTFFNSPVTDDVKQNVFLLPTQNMACFEKFSKGLQFYYDKRMDESYNFFLSSVKADTKFLDAHRYFEYTARKNGKLDEFITLYEDMLKKEPENPILMNYLGNAYVDKSEFDKAENLYKKAIKIAPTFAQPHANLGVLFSKKENYKGALSEYEKALKYSDKKGPIYYSIGLTYFNMAEKTKAKEYFTKALEVDPKNPDFVVARYVVYGVKVHVKYREKEVPGKVFGEVLMNEEPIYEIQTSAAGLTPVERAKVIADRLQILMNNNLKPYELEIGKMNNEIVIQTVRGKLIMTITKDLAKREGTTVEKLAKHKLEVLQKIITSSTSVSYTPDGFTLQLGNDVTVKDPSCETEEVACLYKGDELYNKGKPDEAEEQYLKALAINPDFYSANLSLGIVYYDNKDYENSVKYFTAAIKNSSDSGEPHIWLGKTYLAQDKKDEAKKSFNDALKLEPDNQEVKDYLKKL